jgi:hypothetical protein
MNLRNPGLKLLWWCASRRLSFPPTALDVALYNTRLATNQNSIGVVSVAKNALSFIRAFNDISTAQYDNLRANAALEATRRKHKLQVRKAAGLTVPMVREIMDAYGHAQPRCSPREQWQLAMGTAISLGFKLLLRYDDLSRCRWDKGYGEVLRTHISFYLDGRKNNIYDGDFLDVAAPADQAEFGVYHMCLFARLHFATGHVLASVNAQGVVDTTRCMAHSSFV